MYPLNLSYPTLLYCFLLSSFSSQPHSTPLSATLLHSMLHCSTLWHFMLLNSTLFYLAKFSSVLHVLFTLLCSTSLHSTRHCSTLLSSSCHSIFCHSVANLLSITLLNTTNFLQDAAICISFELIAGELNP